MTEEEIQKLVRQRHEAIRLIGVLVERAGGEVIILPDELAPDRNVGRELIGFTGAIRLTSERT